uniref:G-protein coupled receptors family 1 profile domain-containing protein n=1 Tax=Apteryx owenii TaxID=8824 RepID=A0A8B9PWL7_APTOW
TLAHVLDYLCPFKGPKGQHKPEEMWRGTMRSATGFAQRSLSSLNEFLLLGFADTREMQLLHAALFLGIYLAALLGNILIITAVACDHRLHTPIYFFRLNLSILDLGSISTTVPKSMANSLWNTRAISYSGCLLSTHGVIGGLQQPHSVVTPAVVHPRFLNSWVAPQSKSLFYGLHHPEPHTCLCSAYQGRKPEKSLLWVKAKKQ